MLYQWYMDYTKHGSVNLLCENNLFPKENHKVRKRLGQITATFLPSIPPLLTAFLYYDRLL